jgi:hypothetical protein
MSKKVILITQVYKHIPIGIYEIEHENLECYVIKGLLHNKSRFVECSSLLLELF